MPSGMAEIVSQRNVSASKVLSASDSTISGPASLVTPSSEPRGGVPHRLEGVAEDGGVMSSISGSANRANNHQPDSGAPTAILRS